MLRQAQHERVDKKIKASRRTPIARPARATIRALISPTPDSIMALELNQLRRLIDDLAERCESLRGFL
jgi:hypothetical protein